MVRALGSAVLLVFAAAVMHAPSAHADTADINAAARSVVRVVIVLRDSTGYDVIGHGTGFAVTPTLIVTNAHVLAPLIEDPRLRLGIVPAQGRSGYFARIVRVANNVDLALVELTEKASLPVSTLYPGRVEDGADVYAVGYPANVDQALGLGLGGLVSPQAPVKTRGQVSGGRSAAEYDTILHTAAIGVGNSGGPLLDPCGRVVGVNSFGTISDNGSDSEFYFAVSMRELAPFLRKAGVKARYNSQPCRSLADYDAAQSARALREAAERRARTDALAAQRRIEAERASRRAELKAIDQRDTQMALAGLLLALALLGGGGAVYFYGRDRREQGMASSVFTALCVMTCLMAWFTRPSIDDVVRRADEAGRAALSAGTDQPLQSVEYDRGRFVCALLPERSRVTVSDTKDVSLQWSGDGCVDGKIQYGHASGEWSRVRLSDGDQTISVDRYDPVVREFSTDRFLVDLSVMNAAREARSQYQAPACGAGEDAARTYGEQQQTIRRLLPSSPNERLVYRCTAAAPDSNLAQSPDKDG